MRYIVWLVLVLAVSGCTAATAMRPVEARARLLAEPGVAAWYAAHSAPAVLAEMSPREARRWRKYTPAVTFDLAEEGYLVKLEARFGPEPRMLEAMMDRESGAFRFK
ncbi:MAG TPA: hypothetical protein VD969_11650 [Symbiobacteriaceae bacterium]|nr:hypothetical protein [Symbiobacteriaceae bacterium]